MAYLINVVEAKKADNQTIIDTIKKLSQIHTERYLNNPNFDPEQVFRALLADDCFDAPEKIREPFLVNDAIVAVPSLIPKKGYDGSYRNGNSVTSVIQLPGEQPFYTFVEDTETFIDNRVTNLRGGRSISMHKIIPNMIISFHHYRVVDDSRERYRIDAVKITYDSQGHAVCERVPEEEALIKMPAYASGK